jgi:putative ABC transport system permease protein
VRTAVRSPGYSAIAIVTLALAIGANTLLFSIANPLLVRSLPLKDPDTLGWVAMANPSRDVLARGRASAPDLLEWRAASKSFSQIAAYGVKESTLTGLGDAERIQNACATASLGDVWGLTPVAGRALQPADEEPGRETAAVLGHRFWRERFNASPDAVGRRMSIDGKPAVIVGVMKPDIEIGNLALIDVWTPLLLDAASPRDDRTLRVVGRLKPGVTLAAADAEFHTMSAVQARDHRDTNEGWIASVTSTLDALASPSTWVILGLLGVVVLFVLIIACVNLANLVLARTVARRHDFAVQAALGASRIQLIRPLLCESLILSIAGALAGLAFAQAGLRAINAAASEQFLRTVSIDTNVLVFTAIMAVLTPLLFSLWPAWSAGRAPAVEAIRESRGSSGRHSGRRRSVLIASQVALALSLLVVSGLVVQSMLYIIHVDIGLDVDKLVTYRFELPAEKYGASDQQARFAEGLARDLAAIPNATGASVLSHVPLFEGEVRRRLSGTLKDGSAEDERPWATWFGVSPEFFRTAGMPLLAGRGFEPSDRWGSQPVAILNRYAAEKYFESIPAALGRTLVISGGTTGDRPVTIVGIAKGTPNSVNWTLSDPQIYVPFGQWPARAMSVFIRSDAGIEMSSVRAVMRQTDPDVAVANLKTMRQVQEEDLSSGVIINGLFIGFAALALALAAAGLYGVISYSVGQRRREFGVRLALGAAPSAIRRMVLGEGLRVVGIGAVIGLVMAAGLAYAARSLLYGISASDPLTFVAVTGAVLLVGVGAMWAPAVRAMRVDPVKTLKAE